MNIFIFIFGAVMGSFLNVLSDRLPNDRSILGRSHCEICKNELAWFDLIPVLSFLSLKGKCRYCSTKLSYFYPAVEVATGAVFVITWNVLPFNFLYFVIVSALLVIFFADLKYQIIPDSMQIILVVCGFLLHAPHFRLNEILPVFFQGLLVMAPILTLYLLTKGRGMGFGDVKLSYVIGVLFGIKIGLVALYIAFILGSIVGVTLILGKRKAMHSKIAFGPFMVTAMFVGLFFQPQLRAILRLFWGI